MNQAAQKRIILGQGRQQQGLSLMEMLIALVVLAVLMAGLAELVVTNSRNATATGSLARIQDTGRAAIQIISADIRRAGYLGGNIAVADIGGSLGVAASANTCVADSNWGRMLARPIFGINDTTNAASDYACVAADFLRGDILAVRYTNSQPVTGAMVATRPYLRSTLFQGAVFPGSAATSSINRLEDVNSRDYEIIAHAYYVGNTPRKCNDTGEDSDIPIPALFRVSIGDNGLPVSNEILAGVEHLQFKFKAGNQYLDADEVTDWSTIEAVETTVLVRSECTEVGFLNNRNFTMGDLVGSYGPEDAFRRQVFHSVTQIRNVGNL